MSQGQSKFQRSIERFTGHNGAKNVVGFGGPDRIYRPQLPPEIVDEATSRTPLLRARAVHFGRDTGPLVKQSREVTLILKTYT
jgi:hypothetical protein